MNKNVLYIITDKNGNVFYEFKRYSIETIEIYKGLGYTIKIGSWYHKENFKRWWNLFLFYCKTYFNRHRSAVFKAILISVAVAGVWFIIELLKKAFPHN